MFGKLFGDKGKRVAAAPPARLENSPFKTPKDYRRIIETILAQAESFKRLKRETDAEKKLGIARGLGYEYIQAFPDSADAMLLNARISRLGGQLEFAEELLGGAKKLSRDEITSSNIQHERRLLRMEKDVAAGNEGAMAMTLFIYLCQHCGSLVEYVSVPCITCGWRPTTMLEAGFSVRLLTQAINLSQLQFIGERIKAGSDIKDVAPNLEEIVHEDQADTKSPMYTFAKSAYQAYQDKQTDVYFSWSAVATCSVCGTVALKPWESTCAKCKQKLYLPPPLRLLRCFKRLSSHILHNVVIDEGGVQELGNGELGRTRTTQEYFIHYLVSLHSKLCRTQETPSDRERARVLAFLEEIGEFRIADGKGKVIVRDPHNMACELSSGLTAEEQTQVKEAAVDLRYTLKYMVEWMTRRKALC